MKNVNSLYRKKVRKSSENIDKNKLKRKGENFMKLWERDLIKFLNSKKYISRNKKVIKEMFNAMWRGT